MLLDGLLTTEVQPCFDLKIDGQTLKIFFPLILDGNFFVGLKFGQGS